MEGSSEIFKALIALYSNNGAIIRAAFSKIEDCRTGVKIENYTHPTSINTENLDYRNASYISEMTIEMDDLLGYSSYDGFYGVYLDNVYGVHIQGSFIHNANGSTFTVTDCNSLGKGIYSYNSIFSMHKSGDVSSFDETTGCVDYNGSKCTIQRFSYGVYCEEPSIPTSIRPKFMIQENNFNYNQVGVAAYGGTDYAFKDNIVHVNTSLIWGLGYSCSVNPKGVLFDHVRSFGVVNNTFDVVFGLYTSSTTTPFIDLLEIVDCGDAANKIQDNGFSGQQLQSFYGIQETGIRLSGNNSQVEPWCNNTISRLSYGIYVESGSTINTTWGSPGINVANTYSQNYFYDLYNATSSNIGYYAKLLEWSAITKNNPWTPQYEENPNCPTLNCMFWTPLNVGQAIQNTDVRVYPNPTNHHSTLNLESEKMIEGTIKVIDIQGKTILTQQLTLNNRFQINISKLKPGSYMVLIENPTYRINKIVIIN